MGSRVLVLDGHSKAAAETVLALPKTCTVDVAAVEPDCLSFVSRRVAQRLRQPDAADELRTWLTARDEVESYDLIVPSTERSLIALKSQSLPAHLRAKLVIPDEASIDLALNKQETLAIAQALGIKVPHSVLVHSLDELGERSCYPAVVKPINSKVMVNGELRTLAVRLCATAAERHAACREFLPHTPVIEQEYFRGRGFGVEALFDYGALCWSFAHERIHEFPLTGGASTYRRSVVAPVVIADVAIALLQHLRWHGVAMVEFKVAADGDYRLMEINPRLWGSLPLAVAAGVNFPLGLLRMAHGQCPGEQPQYRERLYMRDMAADWHWFVHSWRARGKDQSLSVSAMRSGDVVALLRPLLGRERWDLFRWREPELWFALSRRSLGRALNGLRNRRRIAAIR